MEIGPDMGGHWPAHCAIHTTSRFVTQLGNDLSDSREGIYSRTSTHIYDVIADAITPILSIPTQCLYRPITSCPETEHGCLVVELLTIMPEHGCSAYSRYIRNIIVWLRVIWFMHACKATLRSYRSFGTFEKDVDQRLDRTSLKLIFIFMLVFNL